MPPTRRVWPTARLAGILILGAACAAEAGETEARHTQWRACLRRTFGIQAALAGRDLAADAAFQACRGAEQAYITALAGSPLLDDDDVARARPLLAGRTRAWLVGGSG